MAERESLYLWSSTALTNDDIDPAINWQEGMPPSGVNNSSRAMMSALARWLSDINGARTTAGTANAYTLVIGGTQSNYSTGHIHSFKASFSNTASATLNLTNAEGSVLGAKALRVLTAAGEAALSASNIVSGGHYIVQYDASANGASGGFVLLNPTLNFQSSDTELTALAGTTASADTFPYFTSSTAASTATVTSFARSVLDDATSTAFRATLGALSNCLVTVFSATGTYTPNSTMVYCILECVGGGGGGGAAVGAAGQMYIGGGGGAGGYSLIRATAADIGSNKPVTIGAGGNGGAAGSNPGSAGGDTSVGALCIGKGGSGGQHGSSVSGPTGGAGGVAGTGAVKSAGAPGQSGLYNAANITIYTVAGAGGSSFFGGGATPVLAGSGAVAAGNNGGAYGGGGSGGSATNSTGSAAGGSGSAGVVIITELFTG